MSDEDQDFFNTINASFALEAKVIAEEENWLLVQLMDDVYEMVFRDVTSDNEIFVALQASVALQEIGLGPKVVHITKPYRCDDGKIAITLVTKS